MARIPPLRRLAQEDFPSQSSWIENLISPLNSFMEQTVAALNKGITLSDNCAAVLLTAELDGVYPKTFKWTLSGKPVSVIVGNVYRTDGAAASLVLNTTGNTTSGSNVIASVGSTTGLEQGQLITATGIPARTHVVSISGSSVTLSQNATATATGVSVIATLDRAVQVQWQYNQSGQFQIDGVVGITPNSANKYKLVLECKVG